MIDNTELSPQQFDPSTGHDQLFVPTELIIMYPASGLFECVVGVWLGLGSEYVSSWWLSVSGWVE